MEARIVNPLIDGVFIDCLRFRQMFRYLESF